VPTETVLLIEIDNVPTLTLERTVGTALSWFSFPISRNSPIGLAAGRGVLPGDWFSDYVASGQFEKYVKQVYHNLRKEGSNE
jgi:hypothetical protein